MKNFKDIIFASKKTAVMFTVGALLLVSGGAGTATATIGGTSGQIVNTVQQDSIGVALLENGADAGEELLENIAEETDGTFYLDHDYTTDLAVSNNGSIATYTRVLVTKSWKNADGTKDTTLSPKLIELTFNEGAFKVVEDTEERTILYYQGELASGSSATFITGVKINGDVASIVEQADGSTSFVYNGIQFCVKAEVQSVQTHNAADAIRSAWGVDPSLVGA